MSADLTDAERDSLDPGLGRPTMRLPRNHRTCPSLPCENDRDDLLQTVRPPRRPHRRRRGPPGCRRGAAGCRCRHCGKAPEADGDHTCRCPQTDAECTEHAVYPVAPEGLRDTLSTPTPAGGHAPEAQCPAPGSEREVAPVPPAGPDVSRIGRHRLRVRLEREPRTRCQNGVAAIATTAPDAGQRCDTCGRPDTDWRHRARCASPPRRGPA